ncbi:hypothetical protein F1880_002680 [Penicillium rolfsii]|nr:hypothetical protein F1880_002680 [Penicillium rolfsii]
MGHPARPSQPITEISTGQMNHSGNTIDASINGRSMNGHSHSMNGHATNGHSMNGYTMHGHTTNGHIANGRGMANPALAASSSSPSSSPSSGSSAGSDLGSDESDSDEDGPGSDSNGFNFISHDFSDDFDSNSDGSAPYGDGSGPTTSAPAVSSLNPFARDFMPVPAAFRAMIAAPHRNRVPYQDRVVNISWGLNETIAAWALWPSWNGPAINDLQAFGLITVDVVVHLALSPVPRSDLPEGGLFGVTTLLTPRPRQPIPLAFRRAQYLAAEIIAPLGLYWYLLTEVFRVTSDGQFQHADYYRNNLNHLLWLVHSPRNEYELFILVHFTQWLRYHRGLFDELLASVDRRRAMMLSPDPFLTAERVYYVDQRAYVDDIIRQLEGWLLIVRSFSTCQFCRAMIWVGLNGHVVEDSLDNLLRHNQGDGSGQGYDHREGPGDVWPGNEAPGDEDSPQSATSGGMAQAEGHTVSGSFINSGPSQDGLDGDAHAARQWGEVSSGRGESSWQLADVEVGPSKGKQVAHPPQLRELSTEGGTHVVLEESAGSKAVFDYFSKSVITPIKIMAAVSRTHAHAQADQGRLSDAKEILARLRRLRG